MREFYDLENTIKSLRHGQGCIDKINGKIAKPLIEIMGVLDESGKYKASCLIALINRFFESGEHTDLLLLGLNLLKGYEDIESANQRRLKYYEDYLRHENLKNPKDTLRKREDKLIEQLSNQILEAKRNQTLGGIIKAAPRELELPEPRYRKNISPPHEDISTDKHVDGGQSKISGENESMSKAFEPFFSSLKSSFGKKQVNKLQKKLFPQDKKD